MLTDIERIIFVVLSLFALGAAVFVARRITRIILRGQGASAPIIGSGVCGAAWASF